MRTLLLFATVAISAFAFADDATAPTAKPKLTPEQKAALHERVQIIKGGDKIAKPGTQRGSVTIVNAQSRADKAWIASAVSYLERETNLNIILKDGEFNPSSPAVAGDMIIYVIDNPALPRTVVAPDDCWGYCNIAKIHTEKLPFFEARTKKLVSRTFAMLCGGMSSTYAISLVGPMPKVSDMDVLPNEHIPVDVTIRMNAYLEKFGVTPAVMKPYRVACQEGWAHRPTNHVEQIIWDEVHQLPAKPVTIEYDPKRGK